jgi:hypothetical protein
MNDVKNPMGRVEPGSAQAPELSPEERRALARIDKQGRAKRRKPWWRRVPNASTLYIYWPMW